MANSTGNNEFILERYQRDAAGGDAEARYELGVAYSCGSFGLALDLIEAHKWFNLAALAGSAAGQVSRAELAEEMSACEIIEAQRAARTWIRQTAEAASEAPEYRIAA